MVNHPPLVWRNHGQSEAKISRTSSLTGPLSLLLWTLPSCSFFLNVGSRGRFRAERSPPLGAPPSFCHLSMDFALFCGLRVRPAYPEYNLSFGSAPPQPDEDAGVPGPVPNARKLRAIRQRPEGREDQTTCQACSSVGRVSGTARNGAGLVPCGNRSPHSVLRYSRLPSGPRGIRRSCAGRYHRRIRF
jgi:hypothetical protein